MADERSTGEPEPGDDPTPESGSDGYQLGGGTSRAPEPAGPSSAGRRPAGSGGTSGAGGQPGNPFEAFMSQLGRRRHERADGAAAERLLHAGRRGLAVRSAAPPPPAPA